MPLFLGIDTSNYKTSVALFDAEEDRVFCRSQSLCVSGHAMGLRQSEALFQHIRVLPGLIAALAPYEPGRLGAVAASVTPREAPSSYMPCFLTGRAVAESVAVVLGVAFRPFSHQQGHIASAHFSDSPDVLTRPFLCWHLSGGTTELLLVTPDESGLPLARTLGGSLDISAGQAVDRAGHMLGLPFPSGAAISALAESSAVHAYFAPRIDGFSFSLSGLENKFRQLKNKGAEDRDIARYVILSILSAVEAVSKKAIEAYGLPLVCSGGVMASAIIRQALVGRFGAVMVPAEYTGDNAAGIAYLASLSGKVMI